MKDDARVDMPDEHRLRNHLQKFRGATAFEIPTTDFEGRVLGNHGDALMHRVYREIATSADIQFTTTLDKADLLALPPSGALLENYSFPAILRRRLSKYPDIPLVVFPSSTLFSEKDPGHLFGDRTAPTLLMLREEYSYRQLEVNWSQSLSARNVSIELDHDVVASGHARVRPILEGVAGGAGLEREKTLVVARLDVESGQLPRSLPKASRPKKALVGVYRQMPSWGRRFLRTKAVARRQMRENEKLIDRVDDSIGPRSQVVDFSRSKDISDRSLVSFAEYAQTILEAGAVITNRLHVALPSAALGKRTYLVDSGYHKLSGVYERSLWRNNRVRLISPNV